MTDLDPDTASTALPATGRHGLWRALSLAAVLAALAFTALAAFQARTASDVPIPDFPDVALAKTDVTLGDLPVTGDQVAVLGLAHNESRQDFDPSGTQVKLPQSTPSIIALYQADSSLVGLAVSTDPTEDIEISARSTAHALLVLSPGVLRHDLAQTFANATNVEADESFTALVDAIRSNPVLSAPNPEVEIAYAAIADRVPLKDPPRDQGCDSVAQRDAYAVAGSCVQPQTSGVLISNQQDRWALVYDGEQNWTGVCATLSPSGTTWAETLVASAECSNESLIVAPGRVSLAGDDLELVKERLRTVTALNMLYTYAGPFADLTAGSAGYLGRATPHLYSEATNIEESLRLLVETDDELARATDVMLVQSTARERQVASAHAARILIGASDSTSLIPHRTPGNTQHLVLLAFFERSAERMAASGTDIRWEANAIGQINFDGAP